MEVENFADIEKASNFISSMWNPPKIRKRVNAYRHAPDGSAFHKCDDCGAVLPFALADMHECALNKNVKRFKGPIHGQCQIKQSFDDQPRSPFRLFMESYMKNCETENFIEADSEGFELWRKMSVKERKLYVLEAESINSSYVQALLEEVYAMPEVDDEADSASSTSSTILATKKICRLL